MDQQSPTPIQPQRFLDQIPVNKVLSNLERAGHGTFILRIAAKHTGNFLGFDLDDFVTYDPCYKIFFRHARIFRDAKEEVNYTFLEEKIKLLGSEKIIFTDLNIPDPDMDYDALKEHYENHPDIQKKFEVGHLDRVCFRGGEGGTGSSIEP